MGVLAALFGGSYAAFSGPSKKPLAQQTPPLNASSSDETDFIQYDAPELPPYATYILI